MAAGGSGAFSQPPITADTISFTASQDGGWTQIPEPKAYYHNGKTYFGYVDGDNGNIELRAYDHASETVSAATVMHAALGVDTHNAPAVMVAADGRIVAAYSAHDDVSHLYVWVSTNPEDISAGTETNIDAAFGSNNYTYCTLVRLSAESDRLYLFVRSRDTTTNYLQFSTSDDDGATWAAHTDLFGESTKGPYWKIATNWADRIDIAMGGDSALDGTGDIFHFYYDGSWRGSDGTSLGAPIFTFADLTTVYTGGDPAWPTDIALDGSNRPRIVYNVSLDSNTDSAFRYARWDGAAWVLSDIDPAVGDGIVDPSPVASLDPVRINLVHAVHKNGSGYYELYRWTTADDGDTWTSEVIADSAGDTTQNLYPTKVHRHPLGGPATLWLFGHYDGAAIGFDLGIKAVTA